MVEFGNIDDLVTDSEMETRGVDVHLGKGRYITVKRAGGANKEFAVAFAEELKPYEPLRKMGLMTEEDGLDVWFKTYARAVVISWRGFKDKEKKEIPYSPENLIAFFRKSKDSFWRLKEICESMGSFQKAPVESNKESISNFSDGSEKIGTFSPT